VFWLFFSSSFPIFFFARCAQQQNSVHVVSCVLFFPLFSFPTTFPLPALRAASGAAVCFFCFKKKTEPVFFCSLFLKKRTVRLFAFSVYLLSISFFARCAAAADTVSNTLATH
jgi:hypothetical protein